MEPLTSGTIPHTEAGTVQFTPDTDGLYLLGVCAGGCAYTILKSNVPIGLHAADGLSVIQGAKRLYFHVPAGLAEFTMTIKGQGVESVRLNVFDPSGQQVATGDASNEAVAVVVKAGESAGKTWSLELTKADQRVLEDATITIDGKLPPTLSLLPEQVFQLVPASAP